MGKKKFYAVAKGHKPGIYSTWNECKAQVNGFTGNVYAGFETLAQAEAYMKGQTSTPTVSIVPPPTNRASKAAKSAASSSASSLNITSSQGSPMIYAPDSTLPRIDLIPPEPSHYSPLEGMDPTFAYTSVKATSSWTPESASAPPPDPIEAAEETIVVYTDGACPNNGGTAPKGGVGVFFGPRDSRNVSRPLEGPKQTNQRAEMEAALDAMLVTSTEKAELEIRTDSMYVINGLDSWMPNWNKAKWEKVENADLWRRLKEARENRAGKTRFVHVRGHSGEPGNDEADRLAVAGARLRNR